MAIRIDRPVNRPTLCPILLVLLGVALGVCSSAWAVPSLNKPSNEMSEWERKLKGAGATSAELAELRYIEGQQMPGNWVALANYLDSTPPRKVVRDLRIAVRNEEEPTPRAIFQNVSPIVSCESLGSVAIQDTTIESAISRTIDHSCRITATVAHPPADNPIKVWIGLPMRNWNGRFRGTGGGGYSGGNIRNLERPLQKGYAVGATDTGNPAGTANFALDSSGKSAWSRLRDNGYRGIHDMTVVGKALTRTYYGVSPRYAYFVGGSTGGRQALTEAQRYPDDYDGILALYPAIARDRYVPAQLWPQVVMRELNDVPSKEKLSAATAAAVKACAGEYGLIEDPITCAYDPTSLVGTIIGQETFTSLDAKVVRAIWEGPRAHDGAFLWWGPSRGADLQTLADSTGVPPLGKPCEEGLDWFRYFLALDPKWNWTTLTRDGFELFFEQSIQVHASVYGGDDPDLTKFRDRGSKLLIVHGWADQLVPAPETIAYYRAVEERMGGNEATVDFARLFLVPGADHGFGSDVPVPSLDAMVTALMDWVERSHPPELLEAELIGDDHQNVHRPLFQYR